MEFSGIKRGELLKHTLSAGNVFLGDFKEIDHKKFFIIIGVSFEKIYFCSVYINSNIPKYMYSNEVLLNLQVNIKGSKYDFLKHDSFISCNNPLKYDVSDLVTWINDGDCKYVGDIDTEDLENITTTVINSGVLTQKDIDIFFDRKIK
jgi:hypothetical protein